MDWIAFSYSLSSKSSSPRVSIWRQLKRVGAVSPVGGVYILPAQEPCIEAFGWLAQQVRQAGGEAVVMHVGQFEGFSDQEAIALFRQARQEEYAEISGQAEHVETAIREEEDTEARMAFKDELDRLQKQLADVARIDYFECPEKDLLAARLEHLRLALFPEPSLPVEIAAAEIEAYRRARWVTRPHPHVDRLACAWLIRRFIHPDAAIRYASEPQADEVPFDVPGAAFSHRGSLCTFEVMLRTFGLEEAALHTLAEIVHEIDLRDGVYAHPETSGVDALLRGWQLAGMPDEAIEARGLDLFDGLYAALAGRLPATG
jgi:hypothetical protein